MKLEHLEKWDGTLVLVTKNMLPCIIAVGATWCGPCKSAYPLYADLPHFKFGVGMPGSKPDDEYSEYKIPGEYRRWFLERSRGIPAFFFVDHTGVVEQYTGTRMQLPVAFRNFVDNKIVE